MSEAYLKGRGGDLRYKNICRKFLSLFGNLPGSDAYETKSQLFCNFYYNTSVIFNDRETSLNISLYVCLCENVREGFSLHEDSFIRK